MHVLTLRLFSNQSDSLHHKEVDSALVVLQAQRVRVYETYIRNIEKKLYVLKTTSKDTHLFIGSLTDIGRYHLACLFEEELRKVSDTEMVVFMQGGDRKGTLVTIEKDEPNRMYLVLSPAN